MDFARAQLDGVLEVSLVGLSLQLRFGHDPNRSVRSRAIDPDDFAPVIFDSEDTELRIGRLGVEFSRQPFCDSLVPCLLGDAIDGINAARQMPTDQPIQCSRISKAGNVGRRVAHVGLKIGGDQPRMRLGAIEDTRRNHLLQAAIAQPSDSGHRDRNQRNHRDGQSGCKRHVCFCAIAGPLARCLVSWTGSNVTGCRG